MPTCKALSRSAIFSGIFGASLVVGNAVAFDPSKQFKPDAEPRTILRYGYEALKDGRMEDAIGAFRLGAEKNDLASQWKLARMLQTGKGVQQDHLAAYELYSTIEKRFVEQFPDREDLAFVSHAVVSVGLYDLYGIPNTRIRANPRRAENHFYRAAALYQDAEAQYQLGRIYRHGTLGAKSERSAARWLSLSARKGHPLAQAELGQMLFFGEGIQRNPVRGLVMLGRARLGIGSGKAEEIRTLEADLLRQASAKQRQAAEDIIAKIAKDQNIRDRNYAFESRSVFETLRTEPKGD